MKHRQSIRLKGWNYDSMGYYFVTVDVQDKLKLFWSEGIVNEIGRMVENIWINVINDFGCGIDRFVVMPDHFHGIIKILDNRAPMKGARTDKCMNKFVGAIPCGRPLGEIIGAFKSISTNEYILGVNNHDWRRFNKRLWQRNYFEEIIRSKEQLEQTRKYIFENPRIWLKKY